MRIIQLLPALSAGGEILQTAEWIDQVCREAAWSSCIVVDDVPSDIDNDRKNGGASSVGLAAPSGRQKSLTPEEVEKRLPSAAVYDFDSFLKEGWAQSEDIILYHLCSPSRLNEIGPALGSHFVVWYHRYSVSQTELTDAQYEEIRDAVEGESVYVEDMIWHAEYCFVQRASDTGYLQFLGCRCPITVLDMTTNDPAKKKEQPVVFKEKMQQLMNQTTKADERNAGQDDKARQNVTRLYRVYRQTLIQNCHITDEQMMPEHVFVQEQFSDVQVCDISELVREKDRKKFLFEAYWQLLGQAPEEWVIRKREKDTSPIENFQQDLLYTLLNSNIFQQNDVIAIHNPYEGKISARQRCKNLLTAIYRHLPLSWRNAVDKMYWR